MALPRQILATVIKASVDKTSTILLIGHNPGIGSLANWLSASGEPKLLARLRHKFPTGAIAVIDFDISNWQELENELGKLRTFKTPKSLSND